MTSRPSSAADPTAGNEIPLVHAWPWKLDGPTEDLSSVWTGIDGTLYMLDRRGLEVFSPSGQPRSVTKLPDSYRAVDVAVRYDGMVYIVGEFTKGAEVWSPGATVTLKKLPGKADEVVLAGSVVPSHAHDAIVEFGRHKPEGEVWSSFAQHLMYVPGDFSDAGAMDHIVEHLDRAEAEAETIGDLIQTADIKRFRSMMLLDRAHAGVRARLPDRLRAIEHTRLQGGVYLVLVLHHGLEQRHVHPRGRLSGAGGRLRLLRVQ